MRLWRAWIVAFAAIAGSLGTAASARDPSVLHARPTAAAPLTLPPGLSRLTDRSLAYSPPRAGGPRPLVVLLHGGSIPMWSWDRQVPVLTRGGFRVLRYDMFGRGQSASPPARYDRKLFRGQLLELIDALAIERPVGLVGFSFGGAIAADFAAQHSEQVELLGLIAPLVQYDAGNAVVRAARLPFLGPPFLRFVALKKMVARASQLWGDSPGTEHYAELFKRQIGREGFDRPLLSFMR